MGAEYDQSCVDIGQFGAIFAHQILPFPLIKVLRGLGTNGYKILNWTFLQNRIYVFNKSLFATSCLSPKWHISRRHLSTFDTIMELSWSCWKKACVCEKHNKKQGTMGNRGELLKNSLDDLWGIGSRSGSGDLMWHLKIQPALLLQEM